MIAERVSGENLFDFAQTRYTFLQDHQKEVVFKGIGKIAMLDLVLGNLDRLVQIFTHQGAYCLMDLEANLGNVMISLSENQPTIYAIDNGIERDLIEDSTMKDKYLHFLQNLFASDDWKEQVARNIVESIMSALRTQIDDVSDGNIIEIKRQMKDFSGDVQPIGYSAILEGIQEMEKILASTLSSWLHQKGDSVQQYLQETYPELHTALSERINVFVSMRSS